MEKMQTKNVTYTSADTVLMFSAYLLFASISFYIFFVNSGQFPVPDAQCMTCGYDKSTKKVKSI